MKLLKQLIRETKYIKSPEEVFLAKKLLKLNTWAGMVKFARSGGEANTIALE